MYVFTFSRYVAVCLLLLMLLFGFTPSYALDYLVASEPASSSPLVLRPQLQLDHPVASEAAQSRAMSAVKPKSSDTTNPLTPSSAAQHNQTPTSRMLGSSVTLLSGGVQTSQSLKIVLGLTVLAVLPGILICITSFLRIIIVLSMLRHAIGMPDTPPNSALIGLALFLTIFTMSPVLQKVNERAFTPFMNDRLSMSQAYDEGISPLREFMIRQTREQDLALMVELSNAPLPQSMDDIGNLQLIPAFMLSELRVAFQIGFVIFLPFLLIDLIVSSLLMALGMMMMPPTTLSLPLKVLMFVLVDGWTLLLKALMGSFK